MELIIFLLYQLLVLILSDNPYLQELVDNFYAEEAQNQQNEDHNSENLTSQENEGDYSAPNINEDGNYI